MKKILILFVFCSALFYSQKAWSFEAAVSDASAAAGQKVSIKVKFSGNTKDVIAVDAWLKYDKDVLRLDKIEKGSAVTNFNLVANPNEPGLVKIALVGLSPFNAASGHLLTFSFIVRDKPKKEKCILHLSKIDFSTDTLIEPAAVNRDGTFSVKRFRGGR